MYSAVNIPRMRICKMPVNIGKLHGIEIDVDIQI